MSLEKKDVRASLSLEAHAALTSVADLNDKEIGEYASYLLEKALLGEVHAAKLLADRVARWGKNRTAPDSSGLPRKGLSAQRG
jgi:hypothetical protein